MNARSWFPLAAAPFLLASCDLEIQRSRYQARFDDAGGVREGAPVYVAGVRVGRVDTVKIEGDRANIGFSLDREPALAVRSDACVSIGWYSGGEAHVRLRPGTQSAPALPSGAEIPCTASPNEGIEKTMSMASTVLEDVMAGKGTVGRLLRDEALAKKVERYFDAPGPASAAQPHLAAPVASTVSPASSAAPPARPDPIQ